MSSLLAAIAIVLTVGAFGAAVAQESKSISARYGSRDPRTCEDTKAPARGAITAALATKYLNCQMEYISGGNLYLVENLKSVEVGGGIPYAAIIGHRSFSEIDVKHPVYPIRGSFLYYQCRNQLTEYVGPPNTNCATYNNPKATGYCYKTTFGDWKCNMTDSTIDTKESLRYNVAPPKGANNDAGDNPNDKPAETKNGKQPVNPKDTKQTAGTKDELDAADRDENGFVKPDFSEMEKYVEIVKYDYNPVDGRFNLVVKARKEINIFRWYLTAYDADGVKVSELSFNGNVVTPAIGEPTRIYSFAPNETKIKQVTRIAITRKLD